MIIVHAEACSLMQTAGGSQQLQNLTRIGANDMGAGRKGDSASCTVPIYRRDNIL